MYRSFERALVNALDLQIKLRKSFAVWNTVEHPPSYLFSALFNQLFCFAVSSTCSGIYNYKYCNQSIYICICMYVSINSNRKCRLFMIIIFVSGKVTHCRNTKYSKIKLIKYVYVEKLNMTQHCIENALIRPRIISFVKLILKYNKCIFAYRWLVILLYYFNCMCSYWHIICTTNITKLNSCIDFQLSPPNFQQTKLRVRQIRSQLIGRTLLSP